MQKTLRHTHTNTHIQLSPIIYRVWDSTPSIISLLSALYCTSTWYQGFICSQLFKINFYWNIVTSQYCVSFCCAAKCISYTYTYIYSISDFLPIRITTEHWVEFPVLYGRFSLVIYVISSVQLLSRVRLFATP